jgi:intein/homing endonuclease
VSENYFDEILSGVVERERKDLSDSEFAQRYFLNPQIPNALEDDPTGEKHFDRQITNGRGDPIENLAEGDPIPLRLRPYQRRILEHGRKWQVLRMSRRCTTGETPVLMGDGRWKQIEEVQEGERVLCRDKRARFVSKPVTEKYDNGVKDVYEVRLNNGRSIECTANHPFLTWGESKGYQGGSYDRVWRSIEDGLEEGDRVVCMQQTDRWGDVHDPEFAALLGYLLTDGYTGKGGQTPKLVNTNRSIIEDARDLARSRFGLECSIREKTHSSSPHQEKFDTCWELHFTDGDHYSKNPLTEKLREIGVRGQKSKRNQLPDAVWDWDRETVMEMFNRMIAGDGSIYVSPPRSGNSAPNTQLRLHAASKPFLEDLRLLMMKAGVGGIVSEHPSGNSYLVDKENAETPNHRLDVSASGALKALFEQMGPVVGKEDSSREMIQALEEKSREYHKRGQKHWMYPVIKSIEHKGRKRTYDISVKDHHNYIADGMCVHNSGKTFLLGVAAITEALRNPAAKVLLLAPNQSHVKLMFDDMIRPLLKAFKHPTSGKVGIPGEETRIGQDADFAVTTNTQKPQEIIIEGEGDHKSSIRGMVISDSARGQDASLIIFDEADYAPAGKVRPIVTPIQASSPNTRMVMSSTPSGRTDSYFYQACHSGDWEEFHVDISAIPHMTEERRARLARAAGGEDTNTFKQEYLAQFGEQTKGVFSQQELKKAFVVSPYVKALEDVDRRTYERKSLLASSGGQASGRDSFIPHEQGLQAMDWDVSRDRIGSHSVYKPRFRGHGVVTAGTDWNDIAGMHTVITWWPPAQWIQEGRIEVSRFPYESGRPDVSHRAKADGRAKRFVVGSDNGDPGGPHDLRQVRGIVIWHGQLESGNFEWQSAANRVAGMMSIPNFIDSWYVDKGYGDTVNSMIHGIMESGEYFADMNLTSEALSIPEPVLRNINLFHPSRDQDKTGKVYKPIDFSKPYEHRDFDLSEGEGRYKDVMVTLGQQMVSARRILFPHSELIGYHDDAALGGSIDTTTDPQTGQIQETRGQQHDADRLRENGAAPDRGEDSFGGLVTQMQQFVIDGYTTTGRPRYAGIDHGIDAFLLSLLAFYENHSDQDEPGNIFRTKAEAPVDVADDIFDTAEEVTQELSKARTDPSPSSESHGSFQTKNYSSQNEPLEEVLRGHADPEKAGTSLGDMIRSARRHLKSKDGW